jgi:hypothetical protein
MMVIVVLFWQQRLSGGVETLQPTLSQEVVCVSY